MKTNELSLARRIARDIFLAGDEHNDSVQRIEFKGGQYPDKETVLGGYDEKSLASNILTTLIRHRDETAK